MGDPRLARGPFLLPLLREARDAVAQGAATPCSTRPLSAQRARFASAQNQRLAQLPTVLNPPAPMSASASHRPKHSSVHNVKAVCRDRAALFAPHVDSFNFFIDHGLALAVQALDPV